MNLEEKILLLGTLFHDIGKFEQRCTNKKEKHEKLGADLFLKFKEYILPILNNSESAFETSKLIIGGHHSKIENDFIAIVKEADHLSASERVEFSEPESDLHQKWSHKFLSSLFSKIFLNNPDNKSLRYYEQKLLSKKDYKILIPEFDNENDVKSDGHKYNNSDFENFSEQLIDVFSFYKEEEDFTILINLLLVLFEKYLWSVPDFTGSDLTDISLYNHSKDVAGIAHAIYKSDKSDTRLNLVIGDIPGIQKYIFNVAYKKPAKILRGRSIYVQILTRQFASIMLEELGLTDANLIMLAGGKFYIISQHSNNFEDCYNKAVGRIEKYLIENFNYQLSFSSAYNSFNYQQLKTKDDPLSFGDIIDEASYKLLQKRNQQFKQVLFNNDKFTHDKFVLDYKYIEATESDKVKCAVTGIPIKQNRRKDIEGEQVDKQVANEFKIGSLVTKNNVIVEFNRDYSEVFDVKELNEYKPGENTKRILLNPDLEELLNSNNLRKDILRNTNIIEVANYCSMGNDKTVMDFEKMEEHNNGAEFMTLIKGDVDNLGLIMSSGLVNDNANMTAISRTTTLSNHLKYFFSYSLNGFLEKWENGKVEKQIEDNCKTDQKVYTVFAGGDDLMLIAPQSSSLKLVNEFNKIFNEFVCENPEVHISYSLTNFKHNTPIRLVADMAEENQEKIKQHFKNFELANSIETNKDVFQSDNDKAGIFLFDTCVKNDSIEAILKWKLKLIEWCNDSNNRVSQGVLRNLLYFAHLINSFRFNGDTQNLIWHPKLTYMINRSLKKSNNTYINSEVEEFFENALRINKTNSTDVFEVMLLPLICEAIYGTRNSKENK
ncbi:MAG: type III-A CRISPR-associated protein Cas10/Csm1 [Melioribacteraceae bacterium]|nr:type III-A CRISPR-associated protein Cas10/Csm1 [Melioribacteraceae bacterium]